MADKKISALNAATTPLAGTEVLPIVQSGSTVKVSIADVTAGRAVSCSNFTYTGTLTGSTGILNIGANQIYKDASGNVGIGTSSPTANLDVNGVIKGGVANGVTLAVADNGAIRNTATGGNIMYFDSGVGAGSTGGDFNFRAAASYTSRLYINGANGRITAAGVYAATVGATNRDVYVDDTGLLGYVSSVRASKTNISELSDTSWVYNLRPVSFNYRKRNADGAYTDEAEAPLEFGLIAEEVEAVSPELVFYDQTENGPELCGVSYSKLIVPLLAEVKALSARIAALESK